MSSVDIALADVERWLEVLYVDAEGTALRREDRKKARELVGLLEELGRAIDRVGRARDPLVVVEAAAGKAYASLLSIPMSIAPRGRRAQVIAIEREDDRVRAIRAAASRLELGASELDAIAGDVGDPALWPDAPDVVLALHACGDASDRVIEQATRSRARWILLAPCCVASSLASAKRAQARAEAIGVPWSGELRRGLVESLVMSERMLELESRGWRTDLVAFAAPSVTPHRHLLRAERVGEPKRMENAAARLARMRASPS